MIRKFRVRMINTQNLSRPGAGDDAPPSKPARHYDSDIRASAHSAHVATWVLD